MTAILPGSVIGAVTALPDTEPGLPQDKARVAIPADNPTSEVVVTVGAGAQVGGRVNVILAADGRATHAAPIETTPPPLSLTGPGGQAITLTLEGVSVPTDDGHEIVVPWSDLTYAVEEAMTRPPAREEPAPVTPIDVASHEEE